MKVNEQVLGRRYSYFVISLLILFPVLINSVKILGNLILLILFLLGTYLVVTEKKNPFKIKELKVFSWITIGYFCIMLLSILVADGPNAEFHHLGRKLHFLLAPLIALAIYQVNLPIRNLLLAIKIGLIVVGIVIIAQFLLGPILPPGVRPSGMINANVFGDISVMLFFLAISEIFKESTNQKKLTILAMIMGLFAIILSGNRGSWMVFIILSVIYTWFIYKYHFHGSRKHKLLYLSAFVLFLGVFSSQQIIQDRTMQAYYEVEQWSVGNTNTAVGRRLEMWVAGIKAAKDSPWFGYGYRNANTAAQQYTTEDIKNWSHLHNEYITNLVSAGIVGLISMLILLFVPLRIFLKSIKDERLFTYSLMGVMLCVGYIGFGITHIVFGEEHINAVYVFFLSFLLPIVIRGKQTL